MVYSRLAKAAAVTLWVTLAGPTTQLLAQSAEVRGIVTDSVTSQPIIGVTLRLTGTDDSSEVLQASTDGEGRFLIAELAEGTYELFLNAIGYKQRELEFDLSERESFELPHYALWLSPTPPTELEAVQVQGEQIPAGLRGFYERRQEGFGRFLTREDVESKNPKTSYDILRGVPGIRVRPNPSYGRGFDTSRHVIESLRVAGLGTCPMLVFLNGGLIGPSSTVNIDNLVSPDMVHAVEVYATVSGLPARFNVPGASCGVIAFWSGSP